MSIRETKEIHLAYQKAYRSKPENKARQRTASKAWRDKFRQYNYAKHNLLKVKKKLKAIEFLGGSCQHCGGKFHHSAYDFHHIDPSEKEGAVATFFHYSWEAISKELEKCILLCSNCHRIHHYNETKIDASEFTEKQRKSIAEMGLPADITGIYPSN